MFNHKIVLKLKLKVKEKITSVLIVAIACLPFTPRVVSRSSDGSNQICCKTFPISNFEVEDPFSFILSSVRTIGNWVRFPVDPGLVF